MPLSDLYNFREQRFQPFSHSLKVFIFGVDISHWLKGSLSVTYGNRDSYNTASFDLSNPHRLWQVTRENLDGKYRGSGAGEYSEMAKKSIVEFKSLEDNNPEVSLNIKESAFQVSKVVAKNGASVDRKGKVRFTPPADGNERKYRLAINDCVFNKHDPIRIFSKNPLSHADEWVEIFCGFVQEHPITTNYLNGESSVRISCYCIRQMLTKTRVQMNSLVHGNDPTPLFNAGFFQDFAKGGITTTAFGASSLEDTIKQLILGTSKPSRSSDPLASLKSANGVGDFKIGNIVCYNPADPQNTLERWHLMTVFGVNKTPYPSKDAPETNSLWLSRTEMDTIGANTMWAPNKKISGPDGRYLHFLLPIGGTGAGALTESTVDVKAKEAEWTTRWEIIRDYAGKLDFQVLTSPSGDLLVEFPLYGFTPAAFRREAPKGGSAFSGSDDPGKFTGLESLLTFDIHQKEETLNDEAEDFPTVLQVSGGMALANANTEHANYRSYIYSPLLAARYGVIVEQVDYPFAGQNVGETGDDAGGVITKRLSKLGMIEFTKRMADASSWAGSLVYRPFLFPNRPIYLKRSARIGNLTSVTYTWNVGKDASCSVDMNQLMSERYDPDKPNQSSFRLLTGAVNTPISYASIWGTKDESAPVPGVSSKETNLAGNAKPVGSNPELPNTTGETRQNTAIPQRIKGLETLYPGFREIVESVLSSPEIASTGAEIIEAFRETERAKYLKSPSMAEFGLAIFIRVKDSDAGETLLAINNSVKTPMVYVGANKGNRVMEFAAPAIWMTYSAAQAIVELNKSKPDAFRNVWKIIDCRVERKTETQNEVPLSAPETEIASALPDNTKPAAPCVPSYLPRSGGL